MRLSVLASLATTTSLFLSACAGPATGPASNPAPVSSRCNAAPAQFAMGRNADTALANEARTSAGAKTVRVLRPNQVVTMEFNAERLNRDPSGKKASEAVPLDGGGREIKLTPDTLKDAMNVNSAVRKLDK